MILQHATRNVLLGYLCIVSLSLSGEKIQYFGVESGLVEYEILGGAQLTNETNLNIQGTSRLRFEKWGEERQEEDNGLVVTTGAINWVQEVKRLEKHEGDKVIVVDYENEQLLERTQSDAQTSMAEESNGLLPRGQEVIAGVLCKLWVGPSIKKCIYKGIVLKQESHILGVSYVKQAKKIVFDINSTQEQYTLPDYPIQAFGLFKDNMKTKNTLKSENICKIFKDVTHEVDEDDKSFEPQKSIDSKKRQRFVNKIAAGVYKTQKKILPELLNVMKKSRECIQLAQDQFELKQCVDIYNSSKIGLGIQPDDYNAFPSTMKKDILLESIEDAIINLEPRMACVKRAQNFIDLSSCMK